jgi:DNA polymerase III subunit chi
MAQADLPQVDFYVLPENGKQGHFTCALIQKAWKQGNNVFINTRSETEAATLDDLLWTFKDTSFLPHCLATDNNAENVPIIIGHDNQINSEIPDQSAIIINLTNHIAKNTNKVVRILEIVSGNENERQQARKRYAEYRNQGHKLNNHKIGPNDG